MLNNIAKSLRLLGHKSKDRITGVSGVITTVTFDLYGCVQVLLHPGLDKDGRPRDQIWLDVNRLESIPVDAERVMELPRYLADYVYEAEGYLKSPATDAREPLHVDHSHGAAEKPPMLDGR